MVMVISGLLLLGLLSIFPEFSQDFRLLSPVEQNLAGPERVLVRKSKHAETYN
jgi:hypothetical protein